METEARKRKQNIFHIVLCIGLVAVIWGGYVFAMREVHRFIELCKDDFSWVYQVDSVAVEGDEFVLTGFAFELGKDAEKKAYDIVLQDIETGKNYFSKMQYSERKDVNEYFLCEYDYLNSGFTARIKADKLDLQNRDYEVILQIGDRRKAYQTGTYLSKGQLMYVNPKEYVPLEVVGTDLEEAEDISLVISKGIPRLYLPELGFYAYQYDGVIYCLMEEKYKQQKEFSSRIVTCPNTTQPDLLPEERVLLGLTGDDISWYFDDVNRRGQFYVCEVELSKEYSITRMQIGNYYNHHWVWRKEIRPFYEFE